MPSYQTPGLMKVGATSTPLEWDRLFA
jgi:hypothetical protein